MDYDVLILGGGIIGCAVAYELSKYSLNVALIEKDYDIADDVALINTAIVYDGSECEDTLMAKLEFMGNLMFDEITSKFNIPFKRCGSMITAEGQYGAEQIEATYKRAMDRGIEYVRLLNNSAARQIEPSMSESSQKVLYSPNTGVVCPYDLAIAYGEVAFDNGVIFRLEEVVLDIERISKGVKVTTNKNKFTCRMVVNTTPVKHYSIDAQSNVGSGDHEYINYILMDNEDADAPSNMIFKIKENGDLIYNVKSLTGYKVVAVKNKDMLSFDETINRVEDLLDKEDRKNIDSFYNSAFDNDVMIIDDSFLSSGYVRITGNHYGQVTMTPSIAKMVCETITGSLNCKPRKDFNDTRREVFRFKELPKEEKKKVISMDKKYGKVICTCQMVTEGEIVDCIRRPLGARTVEGVRRRTGAVSGKCKGAYCLNKIISILARETNKQMTDIVKDSKKSKILVSRIKEFDSM